MTKRILVALTFVILLALPSGAKAASRVCVAAGGNYPPVSVTGPTVCVPVV